MLLRFMGVLLGSIGVVVSLGDLKKIYFYLVFATFCGAEIYFAAKMILHIV